MKRKKQGRNAEKMRVVGTRLSPKKYQEFQEMLKTANIKTMSELLRTILENRKVRLEHYDKSLDILMPEIVETRKQLQAMGVNINQVTKRFHTQQWPEAMIENAKEITVLCDGAGDKVKAFIQFFTEIIQKWLQE